MKNLNIKILLIVFLFLNIFLSLAINAQIAETEKMEKKKLTPEEEDIIIYKGTEPPFSGKYVNSHADGVYTCKQCGAKLFESNSKFDSGSGWPSFDDAIPGAVKQVPDKDGERTEIICARCGAHLGHVFKGEGFTEKNARYCVNSLSLDMESAEAQSANAPAYFAGGCFWGVEHLMQQINGVIEVVSGYMGGEKDNPTYKEVCAGSTGYIETVKVVYDPSKVSYEELAKTFFEIHDPTQAGGQGPDIGYQYQSVVFYSNDKEKETTQKLINQLESNGYKVATQLIPASKFWPAEDYHQDYYEKNKKEPYCHIRVKRFK